MVVVMPQSFCPIAAFCMVGLLYDETISLEGGHISTFFSFFFSTHHLSSFLHGHFITDSVKIDRPWSGYFLTQMPLFLYRSPIQKQIVSGLNPHYSSVDILQLLSSATSWIGAAIFRSGCRSVFWNIFFLPEWHRPCSHRTVNWGNPNLPTWFLPDSRFWFTPSNSGFQ